MNASVQRLGRTTPILRRPDDRWLGSGSPGRRVPAMMMVVLVVSLAIHAGLIATALLTDRPTRHEAQNEIAVEVVQEAPPSLAADKPSSPEKATEDASRPDPAKAQPPKAAQTEPKKAEPARPEMHHSAPPRHAETAAAKPSPAKPSPAKPAPTAPAQRKAAESAEQLAALEQELASLRAERAALAAERNVAATTRIGPHSFEAVALPSTSDTGEATGYESLVFSQLYKAKEAHRHEGLPGTATVVFEVDDAGKLVDASIAVPSGIAALDAEALQLIREAEPFPPPPAGARHEFSANVSFVVGKHD